MEFGEESLHNIDNAIEAMDIAGRKRGRFSYGETSLKNEGESEKPHRSAGKWPPEKVDHTFMSISQDNIDIWDPNVEGLKG